MASKKNCTGHFSNFLNNKAVARSSVKWKQTSNITVLILFKSKKNGRLGTDDICFAMRMRLCACKMAAQVTTQSVSRELKQLRRRRLQKNNRFNDQNNSSARASRLLVHFFDVHCTTTTWNLLIWRFMEDVDIRRRIFLPLFEPE